MKKLIVLTLLLGGCSRTFYKDDVLDKNFQIVDGKFKAVVEVLKDHQDKMVAHKWATPIPEAKKEAKPNPS